MNKDDSDLLCSIIAPCRNEEAFIDAFIDSLLQQSYPIKELELIIVDGDSSDKTRDKISTYTKKYPFIQLIQNPERIVPTALNLAIEAARGRYIIRLDVHATYHKDYIQNCLKHIQSKDADNVGGICKIEAREETWRGRAIAEILSHPFSAGNAQYRISTSPDPKYVDTVPFGCFRKEIFYKIGGFIPQLSRNQDFELNQRILKHGGKILLCPDIQVTYLARSRVGAFASHMFNNGYWCLYYCELMKKLPAIRHLVPLFFVLGIILGPILGYLFPVTLVLYASVLGLYLLLAIGSGVQIAIQKRQWRFLFLCPPLFAILHISSGLGSLHCLITRHFRLFTGSAVAPPILR